MAANTNKYTIFAAKKKLLTIFAAALAMTACNFSAKDSDRCNTQISEYLYGVEYDDYDFDACKEYFDNQYIPAGACSEVRRVDYASRSRQRTASMSTASMSASM